MTPRDYQLRCIDAVIAGWIDFRRQLIVCPTGSGKTCLFAWIAQRTLPARTLILAHREELIDQAIAKLHAATGITASKEKAEFVASRTASVVVASVQTMLRRLDKWAPDHFGLVVADEAHHCFPYETEVLTSLGWVAIGDIVRFKQRILVASVRLEDNRCEWKPVTGWFCNPAQDLVTVHHEFGYITCTRDHKIWTTRGYVRAENLVPGMQLRVVRKGIQANKSVLCSAPVLHQGVPREVDRIETADKRSPVGPKQETSRGQKVRMVRENVFQKIERKGKRPPPLLLSKVRASVEPFSTGIQEHSKTERLEDARCVLRNEKTGYFKENEGEQPNEATRGVRENEAVALWKNVSGARWEWNLDGTTEVASKRSRSWLENGIRGCNRGSKGTLPVSSTNIQSGHREPEGETCYRSGWEIAPVKEVEIPRREEGISVGFSRVVGVEVHKSGSDKPSSCRCGKSGALYDIEVGDNHNYFAEGVLVSNCISDSWQKVLQHFSGANILGVTATPDRGDKRELGEYFEAVAFEVDLFDLIGSGYLCPITVQSIPLRIDLSNVRQVAGDFRDDDLADALDPYLEPIAAAIKEHASFRRVLAFLPLRATSRKFVDACRTVGLTAEHVDGDSPDRQELLERFARWDFDVLSNAMLLTEGYDCPPVDCVVVLRPTRSRPLYAQMCGRGTRVAPGKDNLLLLDFLWAHERLSIVHPASLIAKSEEEAQAITAKTELAAAMPGDAAEHMLDLRDLANSVQNEREEKLRKELAAKANRKATCISAEEWALRRNKRDILDYEPTMKWESAPVSEKQARVLTRAGIDLDTVKGKGHASQIISVIFGTQPIQLASHAQRATMRKLGHPNPDQATVAEARSFFASRRQRIPVSA